MNKNESKYFNTAKKMNDALISLLERKDFDYITVKDVCSEAGVNRSTFYLHYSTTKDVLEEVIGGLTSSFNEHFSKSDAIKNAYVSGNLKDLYLISDEYLIPYLEFIKENKMVYRALKHSPELFNTKKTYNMFYEKVFKPILNKFGLDEKWQKYMMDYYMNGLSALILDWVNDDCKIPITELTHFIEGLIVKYNNEKKTEN